MIHYPKDKDGKKDVVGEVFDSAKKYVSLNAQMNV
jgi:hypothetical protein